jgi:hypothetical protein
MYCALHALLQPSLVPKTENPAQRAKAVISGLDVTDAPHSQTKCWRIHKPGDWYAKK